MPQKKLNGLGWGIKNKELSIKHFIIIKQAHKWLVVPTSLGAVRHHHPSPSSRLGQHGLLSTLRLAGCSVKIGHLQTTWPHERYLITAQVPHADHNLNQTGSRAASSLWRGHWQTFPAVLFVGRENLIISRPTASVRYCPWKAHDLLPWRPLATAKNSVLTKSESQQFCFYQSSFNRYLVNIPNLKKKKLALCTCFLKVINKN